MSAEKPVTVSAHISFDLSISATYLRTTAKLCGVEEGDIISSVAAHIAALGYDEKTVCTYSGAVFTLETRLYGSESEDILPIRLIKLQNSVADFLKTGRKNKQLPTGKEGS